MQRAARSPVSIRLSAGAEPLTDCDADGTLDVGLIITNPSLDLDGNCVLNSDDIAQFVLDFLSNSPEADLNADGKITLDDIVVCADRIIADCP